MKSLPLLWALADPTVHVEIDDAAQVQLATGDDEGFESWLGHRLVEEGYAIGDAEHASIVLRVHVEDGVLRIEGESGARHDAVTIDESGDPVGRLELLHHAIAVLERVEPAPAPVAPAALAPANAPTPASEPAPASEHTSARVVPIQHVRAPLVGRLHLRAGAIGRRAAVDAVVSAGLRVGRAVGPGVRLELGVWPSRPRGGVAVLEVAPSIGFGWSFALGRRVELEPALLGGVLVHSWRYDSMRRARVDGNFELPLELAVRIGRGVRFVVVPSVGVATRGREHVVRGRAVWERGALRGGLALGIAWQSERQR